MKIMRFGRFPEFPRVPRIDSFDLRGSPRNREDGRSPLAGIRLRGMVQSALPNLGDATAAADSNRVCQEHTGGSHSAAAHASSIAGMPESIERHLVSLPD